MHGSDVSLVIFDIDGCLKPSGEERTDLESLRELGDVLEDLDVPVIMLTGRPAQYIFSVAMDLGPGAFAGGVPSVGEYGLHYVDPVSQAHVSTHNLSDGSKMFEIREAVREELQDSEAFIEPGKEYMTSVKANGVQIDQLQGRIGDVLNLRGWDDDFYLTHSQTAVDILPQGAGKKAGLEHLEKNYDVDISRAVGIGDSDSDEEWLSTIGQGYTPSNGSEQLRNNEEIYNLDSKTTRAALQMIKHAFGL